MINKKDLIVGKELWYSNIKLNSKFRLFGDPSNYFTKVRVVLCGPFIRLLKLDYNKGYLSYTGFSHYIHFNIKESNLSQLFYTEQEAIENWNSNIEVYLIKLNKLLDQKISYIEEDYSEFSKAKEFIKNFKENFENLNKFEYLTEISDIKNQLLYRLNYNFFKNEKKDLSQYSSYFSFNILKFKEEQGIAYLFDTYYITKELVGSKTLDEVINYCEDNKLIYTSLLYKSNLKNQKDVYVGISNFHINSIEKEYYNFIDDINNCYNDIYNYLVSLRK